MFKPHILFIFANSNLILSSNFVHNSVMTSTKFQHILKLYRRHYIENNTVQGVTRVIDCSSARCHMGNRLFYHITVTSISINNLGQKTFSTMNYFTKLSLILSVILHWTISTKTCFLTWWQYHYLGVLKYKFNIQNFQHNSEMLHRVYMYILKLLLWYNTKVVYHIALLQNWMFYLE